MLEKYLPIVKKVECVKNTSPISNKDAYSMYKDFEKQYKIAHSTDVILKYAALEMRLSHTLINYFKMDKGHYFWCTKDIKKGIMDLSRVDYETHAFITQHFEYAVYFVQHANKETFQQGDVPTPPRKKKIDLARQSVFKRALLTIT